MHKDPIICIRKENNNQVWGTTKGKAYGSKAKVYGFISTEAYKLMNFNRISIKIKNNKIFIKRAGIDDIKTKIVSRNKTFGLDYKFEDFLGEYYIEKDEEFQDEFELIKIEE